jgi:hypothetical protein
MHQREGYHVQRDVEQPPAALSAGSCVLDLDCCASLTRRMMPASALLSPAAVTCTRNDPPGSAGCWT